MSWIKKNWFTALVCLAAALFMLTVVLVLAAPKQDKQSRGFVKCSEKLADDLSFCNNALWCSAKAVFAASKCDVGIIAYGISQWLADKQDYPWSNYMFEPELPENAFVDEKARTEYLAKYPNTKQEMIELYKQREEIENEQNLQKFNEEMLPK